VRALDRIFLALGAPRARSRAAYRVLLSIAALERTPRKHASATATAGGRRPRQR
jgi:hypothetical protein